MTIKEFLSTATIEDGYSVGSSEKNSWIGKRDADGMWSTVTVISNDTNINDLPNNIKQILHIS